MKQSSIVQLALFYLVLLVSHEGITVAHTIRQTIGLQKNAQLSSSLTNMVQMMDSIDVDSFLEVEDMHGMSAEAYGTLEMIEMHKSLKEGFSFEHSPIVEDLNSLKEIPENKILSASELKGHREDVSILLEKAMSSWGWSGSKATAKVVTIKDKASLLGECERSTTFTCGKHSDCRPLRSNPCKGECICDDDGVNECECVAKGTTATAKVDADKALAHTHQIDKALKVKGAIGAALFGFVDGFLSGMASELRTAFEDPKCDGGNVHTKLKHVIHRFKHMWSHMKKVHKKVWTSEGRKHIIHSVKAFIKSLVELLKEGMKYMWQCPGTKMLVVMVGMIAAMLIMNMVFMAAGYVVIPLIIKYAGMIMGLYFSFNYMKNKVVSLYHGTKKMIAKTCPGTCQKKMIEDSFGMVGAVTEIVVMSGLDKVLKIKADKAKPFFKRYGLEFHPEFKNDMKILGDAAKKAKDGMKNGWKKLIGEDGLKSKSSDVLPDDVGKVSDAGKVADDVGADAGKAADDVAADAGKAADDVAADAGKAADDVAADAGKAADDVSDISIATEKRVTADMEKQMRQAFMDDAYKKNSQSRIDRGKKPHSRAQWEKSNNNRNDYFNHGNREAKFKEFKKQYYRDNFQLDIEYNKYLDYQKKIGGKPVSKLEFKKVVDKHNFNADEVVKAKKKLSAETHEANLQKQAAKKKVAQSNNRKNQNGAGRHRLSNKNLETRARNLGIRDIQDIKKFKEQSRSGKFDMDYWSKKYKNALELDAAGEMRISLDLNGLGTRARNLEFTGRGMVMDKGIKIKKPSTIVKHRFSLRDPKDIKEFQRQILNGKFELEYWMKFKKGHNGKSLGNDIATIEHNIKKLINARKVEGKVVIKKVKSVNEYHGIQNLPDQVDNIDKLIKTGKDKTKILATGAKNIHAAKIVVNQKKYILKMHQLGMYDGQMAIQVAKFLGLCGTLKDGNALKCLRMSYHILTTLKGTSYTIDDRNKLYHKFQSKFLKKLMPKKNIFNNKITESTSNNQCWKKGSKDRRKTFTCKSELAKLGLKEYILSKTSNTGNDQRRRLLSKVRMDWDDAWAGFISNVNSHGDNDGKCKVHNSLSGVHVDADGSYSFSCSQSPDLCDCISQVGTGSTSADTQYFVNGDMGIYLGVFKDNGAAAYEICEINGECLAYGDVNDGMNARRRRRRLLGRRGGGC